MVLQKTEQAACFTVQEVKEWLPLMPSLDTNGDHLRNLDIYAYAAGLRLSLSLSTGVSQKKSREESALSQGNGHTQGYISGKYEPAPTVK